MWHTSINGTRSYTCLFFEGEVSTITLKSQQQAIAIPVIANGDIDSARKAKFVLNYTGADAIMIGRAAQGNPSWLFPSCGKPTEHNSISQMPSLKEKVWSDLRHIKNYITLWRTKGYRIARKHAAWYLQGIQPERFKQTFNAISDPKRATDCIGRFFQFNFGARKC